MANSAAVLPLPTLPGSVALVGAGPGDPELITVRGLRLLQAADVVVYDRLVDPRLLDEAPDWAERIYAGKARGSQALSQEQIQAALVDRASQGAAVVRLKGGDPFVFGRGGEEAAALTAAGIPWQVVPAVSSALAVPALAGIPVTHRGLAASFAVATAQRADEADGLDWSALARVDTLVLLMAVGALEASCRRLLQHGRSPATPVAVIERGSLPGERRVVGTLGNIAERVRRQNIRPPATVVVGEVVGLEAILQSKVIATAPSLGDRQAREIQHAR